MPSRDEDNSNGDSESFDPLLCQGAVDCDIDDNDTPSSINNDNGM
jgi:hypothetical protein